MKKILLIFAFLALAFSFNANAQSIQELQWETLIAKWI